MTPLHDGREPDVVVRARCDAARPVPEHGRRREGLLKVVEAAAGERGEATVVGLDGKHSGHGSPSLGGSKHGEYTSAVRARTNDVRWGRHGVL